MSDERHQSGLAAELFVATKLAERGYTILMPFGGRCRYDLGIEVNGKVDRLQIKKATESRTGPYKYLQARLSSRNKNCKAKYEKGEFDFFAFTDMKRIWIAPFDELEGYTSVCLGSSNPDYKPQTKYDANSWLI